MSTTSHIEDFHASDELTLMIRELGIHDWSSMVQWTRALPYGRNRDRDDISLVIKELKGTCSSKHALLKELAERNGIGDVKLYIGIYKMTEANTPGIGIDMSKHGLTYIPEAHCYLKKDGVPIDATSNESDFERIKEVILVEKEIQPDQVSDFKVEYHKKYMSKWAIDSGAVLSFKRLWELRERCIHNLSRSNGFY